MNEEKMENLSILDRYAMMIGMQRGMISVLSTLMKKRGNPEFEEYVGRRVHLPLNGVFTTTEIFNISMALISGMSTTISEIEKKVRQEIKEETEQKNDK